MNLGNNQSFRAIIDRALLRKNQINEIELARLANFNDKEIEFLLFFWLPCFYDSWFYLSDEIILKYFIDTTSQDCIRNFINRIVIKDPYVKEIDYIQVSYNHELVKYYFEYFSKIYEIPNTKPGNRKKYYLINIPTLKNLLITSKIKKSLEAIDYLRKVEELVIIMKDYILEYNRLRIT